MQTKFMLNKVKPNNETNVIGNINTTQNDIMSKARPYPSTFGIITGIRASGPNPDPDELQNPHIAQARALMTSFTTRLRERVTGRRTYGVTEVVRALDVGSTLCIAEHALCAMLKYFEDGKLNAGFSVNSNQVNVPDRIASVLQNVRGYRGGWPVYPWIKDVTKTIGYIEATDRRPAILHYPDYIIGASHGGASQVRFYKLPAYLTEGSGVTGSTVNNLLTQFMADLNTMVELAVQTEGVVQAAGDILARCPDCKYVNADGVLKDYRSLQLLLRNSVGGYDADSTPVNGDRWNIEELGSKWLPNLMLYDEDGVLSGDTKIEDYVFLESDEADSIPLKSLIGIPHSVVTSEDDTGSGSIETATLAAYFIARIYIEYTSAGQIHAWADDNIIVTAESTAQDVSDWQVQLDAMLLGLTDTLVIYHDAGTSNYAISIQGYSEDSIKHPIRSRDAQQNLGEDLANYMYDINIVSTERPRKNNKPNNTTKNDIDDRKTNN